VENEMKNLSDIRTSILSRHSALLEKFESIKPEITQHINYDDTKKTALWTGDFLKEPKSFAELDAHGDLKNLHEKACSYGKEGIELIEAIRTAFKKYGAIWPDGRIVKYKSAPEFAGPDDRRYLVPMKIGQSLANFEDNDSRWPPISSQPLCDRFFLWDTINPAKPYYELALFVDSIQGVTATYVGALEEATSDSYIPDDPEIRQKATDLFAKALLYASFEEDKQKTFHPFIIPSEAFEKKEHTALSKNPEMENSCHSSDLIEADTAPATENPECIQTAKDLSIRVKSLFHAAGVSLGNDQIHKAGNDHLIFTVPGEEQPLIENLKMQTNPHLWKKVMAYWFYTNQEENWKLLLKSTPDGVQCSAHVIS
jgi:hypothetical protein